MERRVVLLIVLLVSVFSFLYSDALRDGERLVYDIHYGVIRAGTATVNIEKIEYRDLEAWRIWTTAETTTFFDRIFRVRDFIESIATRDSLYSLKYTKRLHEGRYRQHRIHSNFLDQGFSIYSRFNHPRGEWMEQRMEIPSATFDVLSCFFKVRTMDLEVGQEITLPVTSDGKNYTAIVRVLRRERIRTILGEIDCLVIQPDLEGDALFQQTGDIFVWLTDDERKLPVLLQSRVIFGHFRATLRAIEQI